MSAKKQYFTINFVHLTQILSNFTNQCRYFHIYSHCLQCFSCSLLTFPSSSLSFNNISTLVPSIALDIQHFLKPFTVTYGEMCCHAIIYTHCIGGWVGTRAGLDRCGIFCSYRDLIPVLSSLKRVTIPTMLSQLTNHRVYKLECLCNICMMFL